MSFIAVHRGLVDLFGQAGLLFQPLKSNLLALCQCVSTLRINNSDTSNRNIGLHYSQRPTSLQKIIILHLSKSSIPNSNSSQINFKNNNFRCMFRKQKRTRDPPSNHRTMPNLPNGIGFQTKGVQCHDQLSLGLLRCVWSFHTRLICCFSLFILCVWLMIFMFFCISTFFQKKLII